MCCVDYETGENTYLAPLPGDEWQRIGLIGRDDPVLARLVKVRYDARDRAFTNNDGELVLRKNTNE